MVGAKLGSRRCSRVIGRTVPNSSFFVARTNARGGSLDTRMNLEQLRRDVGYRVKLVPPACHLDSAGDALPLQDEDWIIMTATDEYIEISAESGHLYRLGKDH